MDQLSAMRAFIHVVQTGGFSAAAKLEGTSQSSISKKITALEAHLGSQLLSRSGRAVSPTRTGSEFYRQSVSILAALEEAEMSARLAQSSLQVSLLVSMSPVLSRFILAPIMADFVKEYPQIKLICRLTERHCDLIAEGIDVVIRAKPLEDSSLVARKLSSNPLALVAAPSYLEQHGEPSHPRELEGHNCLLFSRLGKNIKWQFRRGKQEHSVAVDGNLMCDQGDSLTELAVLGCGIIMMPPWMMREHLENGRLKKIIPGWRPTSLPINIVYVKSRYIPAKLRSFIDFVCSEVRRRALLPE